MKYDGIIEKSVMPSIGELMRMPFHVTCVCEGDVPRNATVESVARPYCLTKIEVLNVSTSAIDRAMFSCSTVVSSFVCCTPISFIGRRPQTGTSRMAMAPFPRHSPAPAFCGVSGTSDGAGSPCARSSAGNSSIQRNKAVVFMLSGYFQQNAPGATPT